MRGKVAATQLPLVQLLYAVVTQHNNMGLSEWRTAAAPLSRHTQSLFTVTGIHRAGLPA